MSKKLKHFIADNRHAFDDELPPENAWDRISATVPALKNEGRRSIKKIYQWSAVAAAILVAVACFYVFAIKEDKQELAITDKPSQNETDKTPADAIGSIDPDYSAKASAIYQTIEKSQQELKTLTRTQPGLYDQFTQDLAILDSSYRVLKSQAQQSPNREIIIKAMMYNLQLQAELLSKQLSIISEYNSPKKQNHEKEDYRRI